MISRPIELLEWNYFNVFILLLILFSLYILYYINILFFNLNSQSPINAYSHRNLDYQFPSWQNEENQKSSSNSSSDELHLSYFSSSKIIPIPG
jgi:hypothetical protein